jgi:sugar lactone lactonase YvrE
MGKDTRYSDGTLFRLDALPDGQRLEDVLLNTKDGSLGGSHGTLKTTRVIEEVTCSNGLGWTSDGKKMWAVCLEFSSTWIFTRLF